MYSEIASNKRRTWIIMFGFLLFAIALAFLFGAIYQSPGLTYGVVIAAIIYAAVCYFAGSKWSLALNKAQEIQRTDNQRLWRTVENLSITYGLPMPKVYIMDDPAPNAFSTGRDPNHSAVCATSGLLEIMNDQELEGVMAHELGHIKDYDIRVNMLAFALSAVISIIADIMLRLTFFRGGGRGRDQEQNQIFLIIGIVAAILAPLIATLIQLAISRKREYLADATGALTTRYPEGLASALEKVEQSGSVLRHQNTATAHFFFANPLRKHSLTNLFSTHPPIEERIRRLRNMDTHV